jgi:3-phosphoshikimate 1-carboxyvinyltransferase
MFCQVSAMNNIIEIIPTRKKSFGKAKVPGSKSYTNRNLLLAGLSNGKCILSNALESDDTKAMINALKLLGIKIIKKNTSLEIYGTEGKFKQPNKPIFVENAGTAIRFLTAALSFQKIECVITGNNRMQQRPIQDLIDALKKLGVSISTKKNNGCPPIKLDGSGIETYQTMVNGDISSQYLSALLMAAPCAEKPITITVKGKLTSLPYIRMTLQSMKYFGVDVQHDKNFRSFSISPQKYRKKNCIIESDASSATYPLALAAIHGGQMTLENLGNTSLQADLQFVEVLKKFGCKIQINSSQIKVLGPKKLKPLGTIDLNELPDAAMTVAAVAAFAKGTSKLTNIGNLRVKECDRLNALATELKKIGVTVIEGKNDLTIHGEPENLHGAIIETYDDHRMAMCFGIIGSKVQNIKITNPECVSKTYPNFWKDLSRLGIKNKKMNIKSNIILAGMRGSGKSTLGKYVAKKLHWEFIDTDKLIEEQQKAKIAEIIADKGWKYFRNLEKKIAQTLGKKKRVVISTGGGFFLNPLNSKVMRKNGTIVLLHCDEKIMAQRISKDSNRPRLSKEKDLLKETKKVWEQRKGMYFHASDLCIDTSTHTNMIKKDLEKKAEQIINTLTTNKLLKK